MLKYIARYSYFFLLLPVLILLFSIKANLLENFTPERVLYSYIILYLASELIINKRIKFHYISIVYLISILTTYFEWCHVTLYQDRISVSTIFILLETNKGEILEFVDQYLSFKMIIVLLSLFIYPLLIFFLKIKLEKSTHSQYINHQKKYFINYTRKYFKFSSIIIVLTIFIFFYIYHNHHKQHLIYISYNSYLKYKQEKSKFRNFLFGNKKENNKLNVKSNNLLSLNETYVLVIGESTSKTHLQLYNYYRPTNPLVSKIKNEIIIFNDVISPHTHTIASLEKILTFANYENPHKKFNGTIIEIMKQAGFKTYWISNQVPIGVHETLITTIAKLSDKTFFTNVSNSEDQKSFDEKIFPYFENILKENESKKFIVIHLLGTHGKYQNRYPKSFHVFNDNPKTKFPSSYSNTIINHYDNSILYNDFIVYNIINKLKLNTTNKVSSLIYLSDHGEEVYDSIDGFGHNESNPTYSMYAIPFIYWTNDTIKLSTFEKYKSRKYLTDDLIYSIADMANITFKGFEEERSIFSPSFRDRKRIIKDGKNFDEVFN